MAVYSYPATVESSKIPFVTFQFYKVGAGGSREATGNSVALFMPPAFQINDKQDYEFASKGVIGQVMGAVKEGAIMDAAVAIGQKFFGGDVAQGAASLGQAVRDPKFFNYKEPSPREFTFNYKFSPKNRADAGRMMLIIDEFRVNSYPTKLAGNKLWGVPNSVTMSFGNMKTGLEGARQNLVIKDINTTISEGEQVSTFDNGIPTEVSLVLLLAETALLAKDDAGNLGAVNETGA